MHDLRSAGLLREGATPGRQDRPLTTRSKTNGFSADKQLRVNFFQFVGARPDVACIAQRIAVCQRVIDDPHGANSTVASVLPVFKARM